MTPRAPTPVVHLELRTGNVARACCFYTRLFGWRTETVHTGSGDYLALELGKGVQGGVVEHETEHAFWLPYVEVADAADATVRACLLGAEVLLSPREGPAGWRSIVAAPGAGEIAFWQPKSERVIRVGAEKALGWPTSAPRTPPTWTRARSGRASTP